MATDPLGVLFSSLLWIDGKSLEPYLLLFTLFLAPAEQWLGQLRWLTVGLTSHILATYISEGLLYLAIENTTRRNGLCVLTTSGSATSWSASWLSSPITSPSRGAGAILRCYCSSLVFR